MDLFEHQGKELFAAAGIPWLFDPGQGLPMFDGEELLGFSGRSTWIAVNDYEGQMLQERKGQFFASYMTKAKQKMTIDLNEETLQALFANR